MTLKCVKMHEIGAVVLKCVQSNAVVSLDFVSEKPLCQVVDFIARWRTGATLKTYLYI